MMLYVIAAFIIALAWGTTFLLQLPPWIGLAATGLSLLIMMVAFIRRRRAHAKRKQDSAGEKPSSVEPQEPAKPSRPEILPEIQAMQTEVSRAVAALKSSKLSRGGRDALAVLPWYLLIGPPNTGKSTVLRNSGLKFPYVSQRSSGGGRGTGETNNCDWWLTNEAVFLDTAGRYTSSADSRDEWFAFLDALIKHRPHRPINGLIVTVSVTDLMGEDPQAAGDLGQRIRERIDEMTARLRVVVPIYVVLTKCDLLPGFGEMFADLPRSERGQIWGFTVPLAAQSEAPSELLLKRFDEMTSVLEQRSIRRLGQERRLETRERIYQFPQRFDELRKNLSEFIQPLFMENVFQDTPVMRGLYFTSGTQDTRPGDRQTSASSAPVMAPVRPIPTEPSAEGRSFFIWDVFNKVMFQDQKLAIRSSMEELRQRKHRYTLAGACLAMAMALLVLPTLSYFHNRNLVRQVRDTIVSVKLQATDDIERVEELSPLQQHMAELHQHSIEGPPFWMRMGMYKGAELFPLARDFYNSQLKEVLLGRQHKRIKQSLLLFSQNQDLPAWKPSNDSFGHHFDDLKMYLLITTPRSLREPLLDEAHRAWLVGRMVAHWREIRGPDGQMHLEQTIERHARTYIDMMAADPEHLAFEREDRVVKSARRTLNRVPLSVLEFERIVAQADREYPSLTLSDIVGAVPRMRATRKVSGAFTRLAWEDWIRARMDSAFENSEAWVLDRDAREDEPVNRAALRTLYYQKYIQEWNDFLRSIRLDAPENLDETEELLISLTNRKPTTFGKLFHSLAHNVHLEQPKKATGALHFVIERISPQAAQPSINKVIAPNSPTGEPEMMSQEVERHFASIIGFATVKHSTDDKEEELTKLARYEEKLREVLKTLVDVREESSEDTSLVSKIASSRNDVALLIKSQEAHHALFEQLLLPPLSTIKSLVFRDVSEKKSLQWCGEVFTPYMAQMAKRYPLNKSSLEDVPLREFMDLLHPQNGVVAKLVGSSLSKEVRLNGAHWEFTHPSYKELYKKELLAYLDHADDVRRTLFIAGDNEQVEPSVRFAVRIRPAASVDASPSDISFISLTVDGTEEAYRNGPDDRWRKLEWPGPAGELGAHLQVISAAEKKGSVHGEGEWGLFRLLERAKKIEPSQDGRFFTATWEIGELNNAQVSIDFRPERSSNPFFGTSRSSSSQLFQIFRDSRLIPPAGIALIARGCATSP